MVEWIDECGSDQACYEVGTGWSFVWAWNASWCMIMGVNFFIFAFGACFWWPRVLATLLNYILYFCHLAGVTLILVGVYNPFARVCQYNMATSTYKGEYRWEWTGATYKDDYTLLFIVGIAFSVSWFIQVFFCCMPLCMTPIESKWLVLEEQRQKALKDAIEAAKKKRLIN